MIHALILRCIACRPAAFAAGAKDELTHSLGHTRVHLGLNMAATAVPLASDDTGEVAQAGSEDVVLYFGIIDILQVRFLHHMLRLWSNWLMVVEAS